MFAMTSCAKLQHLDQLLTLKGLSDEQTQMSKEIKRQDARFEQLAAMVQNDSIKKYKTQKSIFRKFGAPIIVKNIEDQGQLVEVWVYRYSMQFFDSPKVYLYWDKSGNLIRWDYEKPQEQNHPAENLSKAI